MLFAKEYIGAIGVGVTVPRLIRADDDETYVVKLKNNRLGTKVLVNEYIASRIGQLTDLCFPRSDMMTLTEEFIKSSKRLVRARVIAGLHFATYYLRDCKYVHHYHLQAVTNKQQFAGVMLFDHLFHNGDRTLNGKNMLIRREIDGYRMYAIDNSHLFGSGRWEKENLAIMLNGVKLNKRRAYGTLLRHYLQEGDFVSYVEKFQTITKEQIEQIVDDIPEEWLSDIETRAELKTFLLTRCKMAEEVAAMLTASIPNVNGGS
ncbi:HipA family kinase [Anaerosinus massiliensis]|uniref:HipA family kinase n=1 Tax=Massilibacillus massiliensis TaxID=1806837 RepID=UPI000DA605C4|nr:HipA family kinase [Massilibacillus massiliensis]